MPSILAVANLLIVTSLGIDYQPPRLPAEVDLVPEYKKLGFAPQAQGDRGDCSLFAITSLTDFEAAGKMGIPPKRLSPEWLIWAAKKSTGHKGDQSMFYEAVHALNTLGICREDLLPYHENPKLRDNPSKEAQATAKELAHRWRVNWIKRWDITEPLTPAQLHAIKETLAAGHPVACGLRWPKELKHSDLFAVPRKNDVEDGHSIAFVGYHDDPAIAGGGAFKFRNSWGPKWGQDGYGRMSYAYARAYANDAVSLEFGPPGSELPLERFEAETVPVLAKAKCDVHPQDMGEWGGAMWSRGKQLFCAAKDGGFVELLLEVHKPGRYRVRVLATAGPDFGIIRILLDGKRQGPDVDLYSGRVSPSGSLELGTHELQAGRHTIRCQAVGKNPGSSNYFFGIDAFDLLAAK